MSLYTFDEICKDCKLAVMHYCDECTDGPKFCHCEIGLEAEFVFISGMCGGKELKVEISNPTRS